MTVQDWLRHTSGLTYEFFTESPQLKQSDADAKVFNFDQSLADMVTKLAKLQFRPKNFGVVLERRITLNLEPKPEARQRLARSSCLHQT
jgi:hypothetical protein